MESKDYKRVLITDRHELTDADFENTLMHFAKLYHQEQPDVVGRSEQFKCHCCNTDHTGKNDDQLYEICEKCFNSI